MSPVRLRRAGERSGGARGRVDKKARRLDNRDYVRALFLGAGLGERNPLLSDDRPRQRRRFFVAEVLNVRGQSQGRLPAAQENLKVG